MAARLTESRCCMKIELFIPSSRSPIRYKSDIAPRIGDKIDVPFHVNEYLVTGVTHILKEPTDGCETQKELEYIRCDVKKLR